MTTPNAWHYHRNWWRRRNSRNIAPWAALGSVIVIGIMLLIVILGCTDAHHGKAGRDAVPATCAKESAVPLIFDTDMGNDIDDALALAMIHTLADAGEADLLAVTMSKESPWSAPYTDLVNTFYGRPDVPIGVVRGGFGPSDAVYTQGVVEKCDGDRPLHPHDVQNPDALPEAVGLLRKTLAHYPADGEIVMVVVGFSTNISRLLDSPPDDISPLSGRDLITRKVRLLSNMAGTFGGHRFPEFNVVKDVPAAQNVFAHWPTPIVVSGFEIGANVLYPAESITRDFGYVAHHPIREAYELYMKMPYDRPCWDLTSVLQAVRPDAGFFTLSPAGTVSVDNEGFTVFHPDPAGRHRYLILASDQVEAVRQCLVQLVSKPPARLNAQ